MLARAAMVGFSKRGKVSDLGGPGGPPQAQGQMEPEPELEGGAVELGEVEPVLDPPEEVLFASQEEAPVTETKKGKTPKKAKEPKKPKEQEGDLIDCEAMVEEEKECNRTPYRLLEEKVEIKDTQFLS